MPPRAPTIRISRLRLAEDKPFLREEIWLPHERFAPLLTAPESEIGDLLYPAYERLCGEVVARAEEVLTVGTADAENARLLGVKVGAPLVMIERLAFSFCEHAASSGAARMDRCELPVQSGYFLSRGSGIALTQS